MLGDIAARVRPDLADRVRFAGTPEIRTDIARTVPLYEGIQHLAAEGDQFQYGGPHLCWQWRFPTPDGRARFTPVPLPDRDIPDGWFVVATRRGKQFNSMVHEYDRSALRGRAATTVLMAEGDATRLGLADGDPVVLRNGCGEMAARVFQSPRWPPGRCRSTGPRPRCSSTGGAARPRPASRTTTPSSRWCRSADEPRPALRRGRDGAVAPPSTPIVEERTRRWSDRAGARGTLLAAASLST